MLISFKYFAGRILTGFIILFLVVMIFSTILVHVEYQKREVDIRNKIIEDGETKYGNFSDMSVEEREEWIEEKKGRYEKDMGIDKPVMQVSFEKGLSIMSGDLGKAEYLTANEGSGSQSVWRIISNALPRTVLLYVTAVFIYLPLGLFLGTKASQKNGGKLDKILSSLNIFGTSMPMWWLGMILLLIFAMRLEWFPLSSLPFPESSGIDY